MNISLITVTYNSGATLEKCLDSIRRQRLSHSAFQHIIIDGGSTDGTLEIARKFCISGTQILSEPDSGIYFAMNKGLQLAQGEFVGFLNSDDIYSNEDVLSSINDIVLTCAEDIIIGDVDLVDKNGRRKRSWVTANSNATIFDGWAPPHPGFYARRKLLSRLHGFSTNYKIASDFDLMLRCLIDRNHKYILAKSKFVQMSDGGYSTSCINRLIALRELYRIFEMNKIQTPLVRVFRRYLIRLSERFDEIFRNNE